MMTPNFNQIREDLRNTDIGREITFFEATKLPKEDDVSSRHMAWLYAAVLYCDISGYTPLTNQTRNETVARILIGFHSSMVRITNQCQGRVLSFAGDRVMSVFALNGRDETVNAAIMCALSMHSIVRMILPEEFTERNFQPEFSCSIGIEYGRVLMGRFGAGKTTDMVLVGDAANLAAKLQAATNPDHTMVSNEVYNSFPEWITLDNWESDDIDVTGFGNIRVYGSNSYYSLE